MKKVLLSITAVVIAMTTVFTQIDNTIYMYSSTDGTTFNNQIVFLDSADVPSIAHHPSDTLIATYQYFQGGSGSSTFDKIGVRFSSDEGTNWSTHQNISISGLPGGSQRPFDPTITISADLHYRLYFSYCPNSSMLDSTCDTYSAISYDGISYALESGIRMGAQSTPVIDPTVAYFGQLYHYSSPIGAPQEGARHAIAIDGLNFTITDTLGTGEGNIRWVGSFLNDGAELRFYGYSTAPGNSATLWWNSTSDGVNWTGYNTTNVEGKDPGIVKLPNGNYLLLAPQFAPSTSINELSETAAFVLYPNPAESYVIVRNPMNEFIDEVQFLDMHGRIRMHQIVNSSEDIELQIAALEKGMYFVRLQADKKCEAKRLFIK